jgi:hypothetical protein
VASTGTTYGERSDTDRNRLKSLWEEAAEPVNPSPEEATAQALAFGVNFRIDLGKALLAAWETSKFVVKATATAHVPFAWFGWLEVGAEFVGAVSTIFASLVQRMRPIDYVTCVVLSNHSQGLTETELRKAVEDFLNDRKVADFSWYLGMNEGLIRRAKEVLAAKDWLAEVLEQLRKTDFLDERQGKLKFKSHHYNIGWKTE